MNPFDSKEMALGYAHARPPPHQRIVHLFRPHLPASVGRALDLGCGAGLSTQALAPLPAFGLEPVESMARLAPSISLAARGFLCARSEQLPFADAAFDLLTAAGSLNYMDPARALPEAARALTTAGILAVYDFSPGRFAGDWFDRFRQRYPSPPAEALKLDPDRVAALAHPWFEPLAHEHFALDLELTRDFYLRYMLTETNVAAAVRRGVAFDEIRAWVESSLLEDWPVSPDSPANVTFRGYWACLQRAA